MFICIFNAKHFQSTPLHFPLLPAPFTRLVDNNRSAQTTSAICKLSMEPFALKQREAHFIYPSLSFSPSPSLTLSFSHFVCL